MTIHNTGGEHTEEELDRADRITEAVEAILQMELGENIGFTIVFWQESEDGKGEYINQFANRGNYEVQAHLIALVQAVEMRRQEKEVSRLLAKARNKRKGRT